MTRSDPELHQDIMNRFIALANQVKDEGMDIKLISSAMMSASSVYETFVHVGNTGGLTESGVDKVVAKYRAHLERYQEIRRLEDEQARQGQNQGAGHSSSPTAD